MPVQAEEWWPEEAATQADADRLVEGGELDVLVTHDGPAGTDLHGPLSDTNQSDELLAHRHLITEAAVGTRSQLLLHGHYHHRYSSEIVLPDAAVCRVEGVASDVEHDTRSWLILDLQSLGVVS